MDLGLPSGRAVIVGAIVVGAVVLWFGTITLGGWALGVVLLAALGALLWYAGVNVNEWLKNLV